MAGNLRWGILATGWIADLFVKDLLLTGHTVTAVGSHDRKPAPIVSRHDLASPMRTQPMSRSLQIPKST